ncbi:acyltransferase family protein [Actinoplanes sp. HUAS TT8]|uniref:acyltransferase family protein n=1 Tax=Actinoplanes sp. HUAS TT8 TaxID=3447453 RepID=UPI003F51D49D
MTPGNRVAGLDGLRGLLALYVVVHHCWLVCFPGYPANTGPAWGGWLIHGRLAVVAFITLSGFSLAIAPARNGWRLGGGLRFARRRARRILPAYWAALLVSVVLTAVAGPLAMSHPASLRSVLVYGLMLQDFVTVPAPNGAFWSIAVEAALYVAFPLLLLIRARFGAVAALVVAGVPMIAAGPAGPIGYTWEMAPLFTLGMVAAGIHRRRPWGWLAVLTAAPVLAVIVWRGPVWTAHHYRWIDLAAGPAIAALLVAVSTGSAAVLIRLLTTRPMEVLGRCSYSLYLMHVPVVALVSHVLGTGSVLITMAVAVPAAVLTATVFAALFENRSTAPGRTSGGATTRIAGAVG